MSFVKENIFILIQNFVSPFKALLKSSKNASIFLSSKMKQQVEAETSPSAGINLEREQLNSLHLMSALHVAF